MATPTPHEQQPAKRQPASRLRNQVDQESVDDERASASSKVRVPDSQFFVPKTQLGEPQNNDPLSPRSAALLERASVKKSAETKDSPALVFKPLTKDSYAHGPSVRFTFGQPAKAASNTPPNAEVPSKQPLIKSPAAAQSSNGGGNLLDSHMVTANSPEGHAPIASPPHLPPTVTADVMPQDHPNAKEHVIEDAHAPSSHTPAVSCRVQDGGGEQYVYPFAAKQIQLTSSCGSSLHDTFSDLPPSAPPDDSDIRLQKKTPKLKKGKKDKKAANKKSRGVPWPPPSYVAALRANQAPSPDDREEHQRAPKYMASPPVKQDVTQPSQVINNELGAVDTHQDEQRQVVGSLPCPFDRLGAQGNPLHALDADKLLEQDPAGEVTVTLPLETIQQAPEAFHHQGPQRNLLQESQLMFNPSELVPKAAIGAPVPHSRRHVTTAPQAKVQNVAFGHQSMTGDRNEQGVGFVSTGHPDHRLAHPEFHLPQSVKTGTRQQHTRQPDDSILHSVKDYSQPHRVTKVQKKREVSSGSQHATAFALIQSHDLDVQDDFDKTWEGLRKAYHADKHRKYYDMAIQKAHFEEVKALLEGQIQRGSDTIDEWKTKCAALEKSIKQLREKANRNQKFVTGLQTDHEKSQKSVLAFQDECKKVLQRKIAELENEKLSLQHEFEATVDTLAKGQRTLKATIDDLYVRFIISESKRRDLAESLAKQGSMYEEERTRRKNLEAKLLPSFHSVQRQLGDRSTQIVQKLENLQASVDGVASGLSENSGVQECLEALRNLQDIPFLTAKDVTKAEGMLRFVHGG